MGGAYWERGRVLEGVGRGALDGFCCSDKNLRRVHVFSQKKKIW